MSAGQTAGQPSGMKKGNGTGTDAWPADLSDLSLLSAVYLLALLTNTVQIVSVFVNRRTRRSLFHQFAGHTSVANLVTVVASFPLDARLLTREAWYPGSGVCKLIITIAVVGPAVVAFSLLLLHMERLLRYLSRGRKSLRAEPHLRGVIGLALAILVWVLGFILVLPFVVTMEPYEESGTATCSLAVMQMQTVSMTALTLVIPSSVLVLLCLPNVCLYLLTGRSDGRDGVTEADKIQAGVLAMVTCLYLTSRLPVEILQLVRLLVKPVPELAVLAFTWLARVGVAVMPCLWFLLPLVRQNLTCERKRKRENRNNSRTPQPCIMRVDEALSAV